MPYRVINIYYSVTCYTNHINSTRIQSIASMALMVFPDGIGMHATLKDLGAKWIGQGARQMLRGARQTL